jgi:hypothetical protein
MKHGFVDVEDHEEFLNMVEDSNSGLYVQELWHLHSLTREKPLTSLNVVRKAFKALYEREGWDKQLMIVAPGVTLRPHPEDEVRGVLRRRSIGRNISRDGFFWATAPFGYWEHFDFPESHLFEVREGSLGVALWPFEFTSRIAPDKGQPLPEFEYRNECVRKGSTIYIYDDSPEAPRSEEEMADLRRRWAALKRSR